jgi:hypothetical protein
VGDEKDFALLERLVRQRAAKSPFMAPSTTIGVLKPLV